MRAQPVQIIVLKRPFQIKSSAYEKLYGESGVSITTDIASSLEGNSIQLHILAGRTTVV